ncbi:hypothetical protein H7J07_03910 [Mycobacterium koreense]|nr:hypothetical protein [Mycolicibacillus koreensis]MCV7247401.1 hypothetical protein [Mycolicibacillus koreensis]BBY56595.1 hypothetical protein MKOR_38460 [Mycolicibacillus koreensis]
METAARKSTDNNTIRHDLEPLTKRFPALGTPDAASWVSGVMGDPRMPGLSTYWIDAIVDVNPATMTELKSRYQPVPTTARPDVWNTLTGLLPAGGYLANDALNSAFATQQSRAKVFLAEQVPVVVITSISE